MGTELGKTSFTLDELVSDEFKTLCPLLHGKPLGLLLSEQGKRVPKDKIQILFLVPGSVVGIGQDQILISLTAGGSEIVDTSNLKVTPFLNVGLALPAAKALKAALSRLFDEGQKETSDGGSEA